jgi:predicted transcriptional regulator with HTH domain
MSHQSTCDIAILFHRYRYSGQRPGIVPPNRSGCLTGLNVKHLGEGSDNVIPLVDASQAQLDQFNR